MTHHLHFELKLNLIALKKYAEFFPMSIFSFRWIKSPLRPDVSIQKCCGKTA
jgi:hypothetical protein